MKQLIKVTENKGKQAVSARELHAFLESKQQFSDWIKNRIEKYDFIENQDFEVFHKILKNSNGGRSLIEYILSMDMAKELAMVEGNEKGKQARRYFIECEKRLKNHLSSEIINSSLMDLTQPIGEKRKLIQKELMETIRLNLNQGDLKQVANNYGFSYHKVLKVASSSVFDYPIIYALYNQAKENLMFLDTEVRILTEDLKQLSSYERIG